MNSNSIWVVSTISLIPFLKKVIGGIGVYRRAFLLVIVLSVSMLLKTSG
jgi:hypothetical protein